MSKVVSTVVVGLWIFLLSNFAVADSNATRLKAIVEAANAKGDLSIFVAAVNASKLIEGWKIDAPVTVFAPNDAAFEKLSKKDLNALLADEQALTHLLNYHILTDMVAADKLTHLSEFRTMHGQLVEIKAVKTSISVEDAQLVDVNLTAGDSLIHTIDTIIEPKNIF